MQSSKSTRPNNNQYYSQYLGLCGVLSGVALALATIIGGSMRDGYDHVRQSISELYETGAPNAKLLMILFTTYHALVIPLSIGLHFGLPNQNALKSWMGPLCLGLAGLLGIPLGCYARCDPGCFGATTVRGKLHGILVLVTVVLVFLGMFSIWQRVRGHWHGYAKYTLMTLCISTAFGIGMSPFLQGNYAGLLERISVSIILQWYAVSGICVMNASTKTKPA